MLLALNNLSWRWKPYDPSKEDILHQMLLYDFLIIHVLFRVFDALDLLHKAGQGNLVGQYSICNYHLHIRTLLPLGSIDSGTWEEQFSSSIQKGRYSSLGKAPLSNSNSSQEKEEEIKLSNRWQGREEKTNSAVKLLLRSWVLPGAPDQERRLRHHQDGWWQVQSINCTWIKW